MWGKYLNEESDGFTTVKETVVVGESEVHHLERLVFCLSTSKQGLIPGEFQPCR